MGLFDRLVCRYPLPDPALQDARFQTKSFARRMDTYTLTADGRLVLEVRRREWVPEARRPYYGRPETEANPILQYAGAVRSIPAGEREVAHDGLLVFYVSLTSGVRVEYHALLREGLLISLEERRIDVA